MKDMQHSSRTQAPLSPKITSKSSRQLRRRANIKSQRGSLSGKENDVNMPRSASNLTRKPKTSVLRELRNIPPPLMLQVSTNAGRAPYQPSQEIPDSLPEPMFDMAAITTTTTDVFVPTNQHEELSQDVVIEEISPSWKSDAVDTTATNELVSKRVVVSASQHELSQLEAKADVDTTDDEDEDMSPESPVYSASGHPRVHPTARETSTANAEQSRPLCPSLPPGAEEMLDCHIAEHMPSQIFTDSQMFGSPLLPSGHGPDEPLTTEQTSGPPLFSPLGTQRSNTQPTPNGLSQTSQNRTPLSTTFEYESKKADDSLQTVSGGEIGIGENDQDFPAITEELNDLKDVATPSPIPLSSIMRRHPASDEKVFSIRKCNESFLSFEASPEISIAVPPMGTERWRSKTRKRPRRGESQQGMQGRNTSRKNRSQRSSSDGSLASTKRTDRREMFKPQPRQPRHVSSQVSMTRPTGECSFKQTAKKLVLGRQIGDEDMGRLEDKSSGRIGRQRRDTHRQASAKRGRMVPRTRSQNTIAPSSPHGEVEPTPASQNSTSGESLSWLTSKSKPMIKPAKTDGCRRSRRANRGKKLETLDSSSFSDKASNPTPNLNLNLKPTPSTSTWKTTLRPRRKHSPQASQPPSPVVIDVDIAANRTPVRPDTSCLKVLGATTIKKRRGRGSCGVEDDGQRQSSSDWRKRGARGQTVIDQFFGRSSEGFKTPMGSGEKKRKVRTGKAIHRSGSTGEEEAKDTEARLEKFEITDSQAFEEPRQQSISSRRLKGNRSPNPTPKTSLSSARVKRRSLRLSSARKQPVSSVSTPATARKSGSKYHAPNQYAYINKRICIELNILTYNTSQVQKT
ncbi:hypothetical protein AAMO2058_000440600 [Amorphochlora amoebiformis]